jgi:hypothetical protein
MNTSTKLLDTTHRGTKVRMQNELNLYDIIIRTIVPSNESTFEFSKKSSRFSQLFSLANVMRFEYWSSLEQKWSLNIGQVDFYQGIRFFVTFFRIKIELNFKKIPRKWVGFQSVGSKFAKVIHHIPNDP